MASLGDACADVANGKLIFTTIEKYESWVAQITGINVNKNSVCNNAPKREEKDEDGKLRFHTDVFFSYSMLQTSNSIS